MVYNWDKPEWAPPYKCHAILLTSSSLPWTVAIYLMHFVKTNLACSGSHYENEWVILTLIWLHEFQFLLGLYKWMPLSCVARLCLLQVLIWFRSILISIQITCHNKEWQHTWKFIRFAVLLVSPFMATTFGVSCAFEFECKNGTSFSIIIQITFTNFYSISINVSCTLHTLKK